MDCPRCGAPLSSSQLDCLYCGRGRDGAHPAAAVAAPAGSGFWILDVGNNKIAVISALREHLAVGLREAKELADSKPPIRVPVESSRVAKAIDDLRNAGADARLVLR